MDAPRLETARLVLRGWQEADLEMLAGYEADAEAMRYIGEGSVHDLEHARQTLAGYREEWPRLGHGRWAVELHETGACIGSCGFVRWREGEPGERPQLACRFVRSRWGKGLATEAGRAALAWAERVLPFREVVALTHPDNRGSQRVLLKLGFVPGEEVVPSHGRRMAFFKRSLDSAVMR